MSSRRGLRKALLCPLLFASAALASRESRADTYSLRGESTFTQGCFEPCLCPIFSIGGVRGSFELTPLEPDPLFQRFEVSSVDWVVPTPSPQRVTGSGIYAVGGELAVMHRLVLDLELEPGVVQRFDSGLIPGGGEFPDIRIAVSMNNMVCFDTVFDVHAAPVRQPFTRSDCDADGNVAAGITCDITDSIFLLNFLFRGGPRPPCLEACNSNDDALVDLSDAVFHLSFCFRGGRAPPAPFPTCGEDPTPSTSCAEFPACKVNPCAPQRLRGVGPCRVILGYYWDGRSCQTLSACECEGEDCDEIYASPEECEADRSECPPCAALDARGVGGCEVVLGYAWDGRRCTPIVGCECEGAGCQGLTSLEECLAVHRDCPDPCAPMDVGGLGPCDLVLGYYWDGVQCAALSGCECVGADCERLYDSEASCAAARILNGACPPCAPFDARPVGPCDLFLGYSWDGSQCVPLSGCECEGIDCDRLVPLDVCEAAHRDCPRRCPFSVHGCVQQGRECLVLASDDGNSYELRDGAVPAPPAGWCGTIEAEVCARCPTVCGVGEILFVCRAAPDTGDCPITAHGCVIEGVECPVFRADDGSIFETGASLPVGWCGTITAQPCRDCVSICQQGQIVILCSVEPDAPAAAAGG